MSSKKMYWSWKNNFTLQCALWKVLAQWQPTTTASNNKQTKNYMIEREREPKWECEGDKRREWNLFAGAPNVFSFDCALCVEYIQQMVQCVWWWWWWWLLCRRYVCIVAKSVATSQPVIFQNIVISTMSINLIEFRCCWFECAEN